jgi:hypothetical protein
MALAPYGWPLKPFNRQHPVRGYLNDPRVGLKQSAFHFGIDVSAKDFEPVFAVEGGVVHLEGPRNVAVVSTGRTFSYWHIVPSVAHRQTVRRGQRLGTVAKSWLHVHLAERVGNRYVNPLRPGALTPFADPSSPRVARVWLERRGREIDPNRATGVVDVVAEAHDRPALRPPPPWEDVVVAPGLLRWRMAHEARFVVPWRVSVDLRHAMLPKERYHQVYAPGTLPNRRGKRGTLRFWVARRLDTRLREDGGYRIDVEVADVRGNRARAGLPFRVRNGPPV